MLPAGWLADGPSADKITSTSLMAVERMSRSVNSPLRRVMAGFWEMSWGIFCGDLAKMTMLASGYISSVFRTMRIPLGPVAPRIKKRMMDVRRKNKNYIVLINVSHYHENLMIEIIKMKSTNTKATIATTIHVVDPLLPP